MSQSSSDDFISGRAVHQESADDSDGFISGVRTAAVRGGRTGRRSGNGRPRAAPTHARFASLLCTDTSLGALGEFTDAVDESSNIFCAAICDVEWRFSKHDEASSSHHASALDRRPHNRAASEPYGYVRYEIHNCWRLQRFEPVDNIVRRPWHEGGPEFLEGLLEKPLVGAGFVRDLPGHVVDAAKILLPVLSCAMLASVLSAPTPVLIMSVALTVRTAVAALVPGYPPSTAIARWRQENQVRRAQSAGGSRQVPQPSPNYEDIVLEMPPPKRRRTDTGAPMTDHKKSLIDPIQMIKAVSFSSLLRAQEDFTRALKAANAYNADASDDEGKDPDKTVHHSSLFRGLGRLDVTCCLLHRREWHADVLTDAIEAVTMHTDASPTAGLEYQGVMAQVKKRDGTHYDLTLPGTSLAYGFQDLVSKTVALLWAVWLICGPELRDIDYFLNKVVCVTTDSGTEIGTTLTANILHAFMLWLAGTPFNQLHAFVRAGKLFPNAIRITGWSHIWGNLAKGAAWSWPEWNKKLELVTVLCRFWRNATWRRHVQRALHGRDDINLHLLDRFNATLAKWRYESLFLVFRALSLLRWICQHEFRQEWFANTQEKETLAGTWVACQDKQLWTYIDVSFREVYKPLERQRRWGMVCTCPEHVQMRRERKSVSCFRNSQRLDEAFDFVQTESEAFLTRSRTLTLAECEGDFRVFRAVRHMLEWCGTNIRNRNKYLGRPPWSFGRCKTRQGAADFLDMVKKYPLEQHDQVTQNLVRTFATDLEAFVAGADLGPSLEASIDVFLQAKLDESWRALPLRDDPGEKTCPRFDEPPLKTDAPHEVVFEEH